MTGLNSSSYYYKPKRSRAKRDFRDADLRDRIELLQAECSCRGYRTIRAQLMRHYGEVVNHKRILRVMRERGLFAQVKRRFVRTTDSDHGLAVYPNLVRGRVVTGLNQVWVADITYIRVLTGFVFLAAVLDVYSRRVVGWALSKRIDRELTRGALRMALLARGPVAGLVHHSDRGAQYASGEYVAELERHGVRISMSGKGNPYDNAFAESFMKTLKAEEVCLWEYESFTDVVESVPRFIEAVYNRKRVHSGIGYLPPVEFEAILLNGNGNNQPGQMTLKMAD